MTVQGCTVLKLQLDDPEPFEVTRVTRSRLSRHQRLGFNKQFEDDFDDTNWFWESIFQPFYSYVIESEVFPTDFNLE